MANKRLYQFLYSKQPKLTMISGGFTVGGDGSVASASAFGAGVYSISNLAPGVFQIKLVDNFAALVNTQFQAYSPPGQASTNISALVGSSAYQIATVGNSTWTTVGLDSDYTPTVGMPFVANATAGSGTGTAKLIGPSKIDAIEVIGSSSSMLQNLNPSLGRGSSFLFQTLNSTATTTVANTSTFTTTLTFAASSPVGSTTIMFQVWLKDSSVIAF